MSDSESLNRGISDSRLYKTGDLVRYRPDGTIEFLGRLDHQVKLRGFRIELGEIEAVLCLHPAVHAAVVVARDDGRGSLQLVAYIVPTGEEPPLASQLRAHLRDSLPDYMVPATFITLERLPLTPNGKVDRRALPDPEATLARADVPFVSPRTSAEATLCAIWSQVLTLPKVGVHDNFFELGGHSLLAAQIAARAHQAGLKLTVHQLFKYQTVAELAQQIAPASPPADQALHDEDFGLTPEELASIRAAHSDLESVYPLAPAQQGMLFHSLAEPESGAYITQLVTRVRNLDPSAFLAAWIQVIAHHPVLRTSLLWRDNGMPLQLVSRYVDLPVATLDWSRLDAEVQADRLAQFLHDDMRQGFDLARPPLMRLAFCSVADDACYVIWTHHHILLDGWSLPLLLKDVLSTYAALRAGRPISLEPTRPYRDFIAWLQRQDRQAAESFWRAKLHGFRAPTPLIAGTPASLADHDAVFSSHAFQLSAAQTTALDDLARQHRLTLGTLLHGVWAILLSRYSGELDVVFGSAVAGRPVEFTGVEAMLGMFLNVLPVRVSIEPETALLPWIEQFQSALVELRQYEHTPLVEIHGWSEVPRRENLFESIVVVENLPVNAVLQESGQHVQVDDARIIQQTNYPLTLMVVPQRELTLELGYDRRRFDQATIARMAGHLQTLLAALVASPDQNIATLPLLTEAERRQILVELNATERPSDLDVCLHQLIEAQATRTPDVPAVLYDGRQLTYRELDQRANQLAHHLRAHGVGPDVLVGIYLERSLDMLVALLGVLKAGGAYVPLDPGFPRERLALMLEDAAAPVLITQEALFAAAPAYQGRVVRIDSDWPEITRYPTDLASSEVTPAHLAYVIFTSGSTGRPKGVQIPHGAVVNFLNAMRSCPGLAANDTLVAVTTLSFDIAVLELYLPLIVGARVVLASRETAGDGMALRALLAESAATVMQATPVTWKLLLEADWLPDAPFKALCGGEAMPPQLATDLLARGVALWNMYGPTETTVWSAVHKVDQVNGAVPIGHPIDNTQLYVLNAAREPQPIGVLGELYIGGAGLARGYLNRPELTAERFVLDPFSADPQARLYRTGDVARVRPDGRVEVLGRTDHQVKIRGFRIEPGEIETALARHPAVREAVVVAHDDGRRNLRLIAYLVPAGESQPQAGQLRVHLRASLPDYMIPAAFITLERLPLTPNGKVDRRALPLPEATRARGDDGYVAPSTPTEQAVAAVWREVLGLDRVSVYDNFFDLGGHSLIAVEALTKLERQLGLQLNPAQIRNQTLGQFAASCDELLHQKSIALSAAQEAGRQEPAQGLASRLFGAVRRVISPGEKK